MHVKHVKISLLNLFSSRKKTKRVLLVFSLVPGKPRGLLEEGEEGSKQKTESYKKVLGCMEWLRHANCSKQERDSKRQKSNKQKTPNIHTKPTKKNLINLQVGFALFLESKRKHTNSNTRKGEEKNWLFKGSMCLIWGWINWGKGNSLFPNYNYVLQKQTFGIPKLHVKAKNVKALLDEPFLQVSWRRLLRKQFLNPNPLKDPPHAMQCTSKAEKPPCKWKRTHLHSGAQIRQLYSLLCGIWKSGFSYP